MTTGLFNVEVTPTMTGANAVTQFADGDVVYDWTSFEVPRGASKLLSVTTVVMGTDGARQEKVFDLLFAKTKDLNAPGSLGTVNATADGVGYFRNLNGSLKLVAADYFDGLDFLAIAHTDAPEGFVLEAEAGSGSTKGLQKLYLGVISNDTPDFGTGVLLNQGSNQAATTTETTITTDGTDPRKVFQVGDVVVAQDGAAIGTITALPGATSITLDKVEEALTDDDEIVNISPMKFILHFEK